MQARLRNNSEADLGWETISAPDDVRSIGSASLTDTEDEIIIFPPASPKADILKREKPAESPSPTVLTLEIQSSPPPSSNASTSSLIQVLEDMQLKAFSSPPPSRVATVSSQNSLDSLFKSVASYATQKPIVMSPTTSSPVSVASDQGTDSTLSPIEKTLLHQITRLSEELEVSKQRNQILEQSANRDDFAICGEEDEGSSFFRLGLKTLGFFLLLSVVQRKFLVSGMVSIFGAAVVGGLLTYEQEEASRRRRGE